MNKFGFTLSPSSAINLDQVDRTLFNKLTEVEPDALRCMACGSCSATCTAAGYTGMSVRKVLLNLQRGKNEEVRKMLSACMLCGKCTMACPRGINTRSIILNISKLW
ncbi:MAG: 4Fe-4S dicluster domain-containing protein [Bacteroidales bacterium]|nr:4Fe-4S dicluster domain-containing protein [Bacteroidales bacterium]